jgi:hypothetical protein
MRIKIIGDNNCARATRHLLRKADFAVTEFLHADAVTAAPHSGYPITIDLAPAPHPLHGEPDQGQPRDPTYRPGHSTHGHSTGNEEVSASAEATADKSAVALAKADASSPTFRAFRAVLAAIAVLAVTCASHASPRPGLRSASPVPVGSALTERTRPGDRPVFLPAAAVPPQGQFSTGQAQVVEPCKAQTKLYVSINQTANTQLVAGTASKKIYICSIHVVVAVATSVALVEGTGSVCATGTAGVSGFGGATAATGWNFAVNGGIVLGNGDAAVGAEGTSADNLCLFNSGSGQVSGGISYVVQ